MSEEQGVPDDDTKQSPPAPEPTVQQLMQLLRQQDITLKVMLNNQHGMKLAVAALVLNAGGKAIVTQEQIIRVDRMQFSRVELDDGSFEFSIQDPPAEEPAAPFVPDGL